MSPVNLAGYVANANQTAQVRVKGDKDPYSNFWLPDECTALFSNSPLGMNGYSLLNSYITYRHGEGVQDANGKVPCSEGNAAWTSCCDHKKYVFICNSFANLSMSERANVLIHEAMHVAGQREDQTGTVSGPSDPPNTTQIQDMVRSVCD